MKNEFIVTMLNIVNSDYAIIYIVDKLQRMAFIYETLLRHIFFHNNFRQEKFSTLLATVS